MAGDESPPGSAESERFEPVAGLSPGSAARRLPAGRHRLPRSLVRRNQRLRIVAAMLEALPRHGYAGTTIGHVTSEAGVSRAAFYQQFEDKEECFLATYDLAIRWLCERVERAMAVEPAWSARIRVGASHALRLLAANPPIAHLVAIDVFHAGPAARQHQQGHLSHLAEALRAGRAGHPELPVELEEMLLGGALSMIGRYVDAGRTEQLPDATPELLEYLLIPYLGSEETKRVAHAA